MKSIGNLGLSDTWVSRNSSMPDLIKRHDPQRIARVYDSVCLQERWAETHERSMRVLLPRAALKYFARIGCHVLDAGCGTGTNAVLMATQGCSIDAIDLSSACLAMMRETAAAGGVGERVRCLLMDISSLCALRDVSYDLVVSVGDAISYCCDRASQAMAELVRVARPGAPLVLQVDAVSSGDRTGEKDNSEKSTCGGHGLPVRAFTVEELRCELGRCGCVVRAIARCPSMDARDSQWHDALSLTSWGALVRMLDEADSAAVGARHIVVVAEKTGLSQVFSVPEY
jgi:ubiquinone/menaquinone biosynthesis C-methylase UbiE